MNLYLISQKENNGYDTYDSAVVVAENEDEARGMSPSYDSDESWLELTWCKKEYVKVEYLGVADEKQEKGYVVSSFNAG
jgi:hypothetical protein